VVSLGPPDSPFARRTLTGGFVETQVPKSEEHERSEQRLAASAGMVVTDIAATMFIDQTPEYLEALKRASDGACAVLMAHPYLHPAVQMLDSSIPTILDAQDAEISLKGSILPPTTAGRELAEVVAQVERAAIENSVLTVTCSAEDSLLLAQAYGADQGKFLVVPNGVDTGEVEMVSGPARATAAARWIGRYLAAGGGPKSGISSIALFVGSWHQPNLDAAELILRIAGDFRSTLFVLVGSHCWYFRGRSLPPNVQMLGVVSLRVKLALLRVATLALNPMAGGSGTNLKLVEYFAAGAPAVSTPIGVRGTVAEAGVHLRVAGIDEFGRGIADGLGDPAGNHALAARARALVEERYDWTSLGATLLTNVCRSLDVAPRATSAAASFP
jgi:hypothetical protein